jgi:hypothetical protein
VRSEVKKQRINEVMIRRKSSEVEIAPSWGAAMLRPYKITKILDVRAALREKPPARVPALPKPALADEFAG